MWECSRGTVLGAFFPFRNNLAGGPQLPAVGNCGFTSSGVKTSELSVLSVSSVLKSLPSFPVSVREGYFSFLALRIFLALSLAARYNRSVGDGSCVPTPFRVQHAAEVLFDNPRTRSDPAGCGTLPHLYDLYDLYDKEPV